MTPSQERKRKEFQADPAKDLIDLRACASLALEFVRPLDIFPLPPIYLSISPLISTNRSPSGVERKPGQPKERKKREGGKNWKEEPVKPPPSLRAEEN